MEGLTFDDLMGDYVPSDYVSAALRKRIYKRDNYRCVYCYADQDLTVDHVQPRALGGTSRENNLVTACRPCNSSKGMREAPLRQPLTCVHAYNIIDMPDANDQPTRTFKCAYCGVIRDS